MVRQAILKEISFVDSGADTATSARIAARQGSQQAAQAHAQDTQDKEQDVMDDNAATQTAPRQGSGQAEDYTQQTQGQVDDQAGTAPRPSSGQGNDSQADAQDGNQGTQTSDTQAQTGTPPTPGTVNASASEDDPVANVRRRMAAETRRVEAIRTVCAGKHPDIEAKAIEEGWDETRTELHVLRASRPQVPAVSTQPRNTSPQVFEAVALMASGLPNSRIEGVYAEPVGSTARAIKARMMSRNKYGVPRAQQLSSASKVPDPFCPSPRCPFLCRQCCTSDVNSPIF